MGDAGEPRTSAANDGLDYDVLIVGAGLSGIYSLYRMRQLGFHVKLLEAGSGEGGTWFWNRYPGARFDSESISYGFSFSQEVLDEWSWSEQFAPASETRKYCQFVTDKFDLRKDMQFDTTIETAEFRETSSSWELTDKHGQAYTCRWLMTAMGVLNEPTLPNIPGVDEFKAASFHTARWPDGVSLEGKRVGIIGVGATGIQTITDIYRDVGHLTVFQRTPNWTGPLRNQKITPDEMNDIRLRYPEIWKICRDSAACFMHTSDLRGTFEVSEEERLAHWEAIYEKPGFGKWVGNFGDVYTNRQANELYSDFIAAKIRQRIDDPKLAEKLIPKCHGFGTRRVPLESGYYEAFNQPNVDLVDVNENPIERITATGIQTRDKAFDFDIMIYATGFDAVTGALTAVDFRGVDSVKLADQWLEGPRTFLGMFAHQFPNMCMILGPHQMFGNIPRSIEYAVEWVSDFLSYCRDHNLTYAEATEEGVETWTKHVYDCAEGMLSNEVDSWMTGVNKNLAHKQKRIVARYNGPVQGFRKRCEAVSAKRYQDLVLR